MAKQDTRLHDLLSTEPAWFAAASTAACGGDSDAWDWLGADAASQVEVTEFAVSASFIEAMFGAAA